MGGTIVALDPDIPPDRRRLPFESQIPGPGTARVLDGAVLGKAAELFLWPPTPGRHRLSVIGPDGRIFDTVTFLVRGAAVAERMGRAGTPIDR